jgi:hypothetical protein
VISLSDAQLKTIMDTARLLGPERRDLFLQRVGAILKMRDCFTDDDVLDVAALALTGLIHTADVA